MAHYMITADVFYEHIRLVLKAGAEPLRRHPHRPLLQEAYKATALALKTGLIANPLTCPNPKEAYWATWRMFLTGVARGNWAWCAHTRYEKQHAHQRCHRIFAEGLRLLDEKTAREITPHYIWKQ